MARDYNFWIYIVTNRNHSVLYIGVTNRCLELRSTDKRKLIRVIRVIRLPAVALAKVGVHSWLKREPQHFDRGGDFDVLVADDEI
jgi:hypothetical protein